MKYFASNFIQTEKQFFILQFLMANTYTQTILFDLTLPSLLLDFKNSVNSFVIPRLNTIISDIEKKQPNGSILTLLCLLIFLLFIKSIVDNIFKTKDDSNIIENKHVTQTQVDEEIRALANQIKNLKNSLKKIIQQAAKQPHTNSQLSSDINPQDVSRLMQYYRQTAEDFNSLAQIILSSQQSILKQLRNIKKLKISTERTSIHGSKESKESKQQNHIQNNWQDKPINQFKAAKEENDAVETQVEEQATTQPLVRLAPVIPRQIKPPAQGTVKRRVPPPPIPKS